MEEKEKDVRDDNELNVAEEEGGADGSEERPPEGAEEGAESGKERAGGDKSAHRMVEMGHRPDGAEYPFATHGPPPGDTGEEESSGKGVYGGVMEKLMDGEKVSVAFVLGVIIVAAVLFIGLMFASQRRRLSDLQGRVEALESHTGLTVDE